MKKENIQIVQVPINALTPADYNARQMNDKQREDLTTSIKEFGLIDPLIVNSNKDRFNIVMGGHMRLDIAKSLGYKTVPVVYLNLTEVQEKELNLRLNRNIGSWSWDKLKDFDIDLLLNTGFDNDDLSNIWDDTLSTDDDGFDVVKALADIKIPKTKFGDHYQLGQHTLLCGDSTDINSVKKLVGDKIVAMANSDSPYNIGLSYSKGVGTTGKYGGEEKDNKTEDEFYKFLKSTIENTLAVTTKDCHYFNWADENLIYVVQGIYKELGLSNKRVCLWLKNNMSPTPQNAFNKAYEPCIYATRGKPYLSPTVKNLNEVMNKEVGTGNRILDDITDLFNIWLVKRLPSNEYEHPTSKPPTLYEKALRRCTKPGDYVLDLFGGSGSHMVASEQMNRKCLLMEKDPIFCDVIVNRFEQLTGTKAKLIK